MNSLNLLENYQIKVVKKSKEEIIIEMPITEIHLQPFGMLHGGVNGILIETAASLGGMENVETDGYVVGLDLQVNHIRSVNSGVLTTIATPNHVGKTTQVWGAIVYNDSQQKIAVGRCTLLNQKKN